MGDTKTGKVVSFFYILHVDEPRHSICLQFTHSLIDTSHARDSCMLHVAQHTHGMAVVCVSVVIVCSTWHHMSFVKKISIVVFLAKFASKNSANPRKIQQTHGKLSETFSMQSIENVNVQRSWMVLMVFYHPRCRVHLYLWASRSTDAVGKFELWRTSCARHSAAHYKTLHQDGDPIKIALKYFFLLSTIQFFSHEFGFVRFTGHQKYGWKITRAKSCDISRIADDVC